MDIIPIDKKSVSQQVVEQIMSNIINRKWSPGTKLPSENELGQLFGVSRVPIREALRTLNAMGITQTRQGEGSYVSEPTPGMFMNSLLPLLILNRRSMMDILEYRRIVEPENAALAARNAQPEDYEHMQKRLTIMERTGRPAMEFSIADMEFHLDIARATQNSLLFNMANVIRDILVSYYRKINQIMGVERALIYHRHIFDAIRDHDEEQARHWMQEHVRTTIDDISIKYADDTDSAEEGAEER